MKLTTSQQFKPSRSEKLLILTIVLGLLHHLDHVLRVDHSGYPFTSQVTPFTWSLLVYPILLSVFRTRAHPWYRVVAVASVYLFTQLAHIFIETPTDQYFTWANGISHFATALGQPNLLHMASPLLGVYAVTLSLVLSVSLIVTLICLVQEALRNSITT
ncbi:MAG TPA: hypothetical protein V6D03_14095 [Candidatus Caenarcaniphilales bacterium]